MSEQRSKLKDLARAGQQQLTSFGDPLLHQRALQCLDSVMRDLSGPDGLPGIRLLRGIQHKLQLFRTGVNAEIMLEWQRDAGSFVLTWRRHGNPEAYCRYVFDQTQDIWRTMDGLSDLDTDLTERLIEMMYPELRK